MQANNMVDRQSASEILYLSGFNPTFVAAGMEGFVFDIGDALLAKVWRTKRYGEVEQLGFFYDQLREKHLPFATPKIHNVLRAQSGDFVVSIEERLPGTALKAILERDPENNMLLKKGIDTVFSVVNNLQTVGDIPIVKRLSLLGEPSLWTPRSTWGAVLGDFMTLRVSQHEMLLNRAVANLEHKVSRVVTLLKELSIAHLGVIHGDICPENVLVDEFTLTPIGLLDFGFLTTSADPLFDAVISSLIFDMYSPRSQHTKESLRKRYTQLHGQAFDSIYPLYKAAYALATSNAYSEDGEDGHFRWCVAILNDEETNALVS